MHGPEAPRSQVSILTHIYSGSLANLIVLPFWIRCFNLRTPFDPEFGYARYSYDNQFNHVDYLSALLLMVVLYLALLVIVRAFVGIKSREIYLGATTFVAIVLVLNSLRVNVFHWPNKAFLVQTLPFGIIAAVLALIAVVVLIVRFPGAINKMMLIALIVFSPLGIVIILNAGVGIYKIMGPGAHFFSYDRSLVSRRAPDARSAANGKVVFIVFDGWDQRLTFESRDPTVELPNLDKLKETAFFATQVLGPGGETLQAISSLLTGRKVRQIRQVSDLDLQLEFGDGKVSQRFGESHTFFDDAYESGRNVAVVATSYHPYCKLFFTRISYCRGGAYDPENVKGNVFTQFGHVLRGMIGHIPYIRKLTGPPANHRLPDGSSPLVYYRAFKEAVLSAFKDPANGFVYVHWMLPHKPYFYDRFKNDFTQNAHPVLGYLDMLELLDLTLGEIRAELESEDIWNSTTLIFTSDHAWLRANEYDGILDRRIPLIIKFRNQKNPVRYDTPFNGRRIYNLVVGILKNQVSGVEDFGKFLR